MNIEKNVYSIYGYKGNDEDELAKLLAKKIGVELTKNDDYYEDEGPYVFSGDGKDDIDYLCIRKQFRVGDLWGNNYHKICPWVIEINFVILSHNQNVSRAEKVRKLMNAIPNIYEMDFQIFESPK